MGTYVQTTSTAVDNRLAVTDNGFGLSSSGTGNNINILDGGAVNKALDFAGFGLNQSLNFASTSLSQVLDSIINGQKVQQTSAQYTADTIASAVRDSAAAAAAAQAATGSAINGIGQAQTAANVGEAALSEQEKAAAQEKLKKYGMFALAAGAVWYLWKGK